MPSRAVIDRVCRFMACCSIATPVVIKLARDL